MTNEPYFDSIGPIETTQNGFSYFLRENLRDEARKDALRLNFERRLSLEFRGTKETSYAGMPAGMRLFREIPELISQAGAYDDRMTGNIVETCAAQEKSLVTVSQKSAKQAGFFQRNVVFWNIFGRFMGRVPDKGHRNHCPQPGIIDSVTCRSTNYEVQLEVPD